MRNGLICKKTGAMKGKEKLLPGGNYQLDKETICEGLVQAFN
jgi:hypothetical protein